MTLVADAGVVVIKDFDAEPTQAMAAQIAA
jgi:hypothetical protein